MIGSKISKGYFITFEGGEGSGKSTQVKMLAEALSVVGENATVTREPGGTPEAEKIRNLLVQRDGGSWSPMEECLLLFAARLNHFRNLIEPEMAQGHVVISDRFTDSTRAYQGYGLGLDREQVERIKRVTLGDFEPDLTFLLDIPVEMGLMRSKSRLAAQESGEDKFENLDISFHHRMRAGFLEMAEKNRQRFVVIDASQDINTIKSQIESIVRERLAAR